MRQPTTFWRVLTQRSIEQRMQAGTASWRASARSARLVMLGNLTPLANYAARFGLAIFRPAATENARQQHRNAPAILLVRRTELRDQIPLLELQPDQNVD